MYKIFTILLTLILLSCGTSVENEEAVWKQNKTTITNYKNKYPYFSKKIDTQFEIADAAMKKALTIADEEEKMKAMQKANDQATSGYINAIEGLENNLQALSRDIKKLVDLESNEYTHKTTYLLEDANKKKANAETILNAVYTETDDPIQKFINCSNELSQFKRSTDKYFREINKTRRAQKENKEAHK
jgi:uncharacterized protein YoxC